MPTSGTVISSGIRYIIFAAAAIATSATVGKAQEPYCPHPHEFTLDGLDQRIHAHVQRGSHADAAGAGRGLASLIARALAEQGPCPVLPVETDLDVATDRLTRLIALTGMGHLQAYYFGRLVSLTTEIEPGVSPRRRPPLDAVRFAIEQTNAAGAVGYLRRLARSHAPAREYLISLVRAERGPPSWPDLPQNLAAVLVRYPLPGDEAIVAELRRDLTLVRSESARCYLHPESRFTGYAGSTICPDR